MKYTRIAGGIVMNPKGKVLVVQQGSGAWTLPKGHMEGSESALAAARRETYEESGLKNLRLVRRLGSYKRNKISRSGKGEYPDLPRLITIFLFTTRSVKKPKPRDPENPQARWFDRDKVAKRLAHPKDKKFFLEWKNKLDAMLKAKRRP